MKIPRFFVFLLFFVVFFLSCDAQNDVTDLFVDHKYEVTRKTELPKELNESSGLLFIDSLVLSFNDSGNKPILYGLKKDSGKVKYEWELGNVKNNDWEDIAQDSDFIYIGDFGNNFGNRKDLAIYKIKKDKLFHSKSKIIEAETISFSFEDQTEFTPSFYQHSFDCEAMISYGDSIFVFSKDWKNLKTTAYVIPKEPGNHIAKKRQTFDTKGLVTGADYILEKNVLLFSGYLNFQPFIWVFKDFTNTDFFSGTSIRIDLTEYAGIQNEGICFFKNKSILMSTEKKNGPPALFTIEINNF